MTSRASHRSSRGCSTHHRKNEMIFSRPKGIFDIRVMSRRDAEASVWRRSCIIISICSPGKPPANIKRNKNVKDVLYLSFHDREASYLPDDIFWSNMFSLERAERIIDMVEKYAGKVKEVIVHCEAGISRSAAIAATIALRYFGEDEIFHRHPRNPNLFVKRLMCESWLQRDPFAFDLMTAKRKPWSAPYTSYSSYGSTYYAGMGSSTSTKHATKQSAVIPKVTPLKDEKGGVTRLHESGTTGFQDTWDKGWPQVTSRHPEWCICGGCWEQRTDNSRKRISGRDSSRLLDSRKDDVLTVIEERPSNVVLSTWRDDDRWDCE